ncbi:MAG: gas vesicle protein GvpG [Acidobacteriota bacterium]
MILRSLLWVAREVDKAVQRERAEEKDAIVADIRRLMGRLESGEIDEDTYEELEGDLLDRLESFDDD